MLNNIGDNASPCLNPVVTWAVVDEEFLTCTFISVFIILTFMRLTTFSGRLNCSSVHTKDSLIHCECNYGLLKVYK